MLYIRLHRLQLSAFVFLVFITWLLLFHAAWIRFVYARFRFFLHISATDKRQSLARFRLLFAMMCRTSPLRSSRSASLLGFTTHIIILLNGNVSLCRFLKDRKLLHNFFRLRSREFLLRLFDLVDLGFQLFYFRQYLGVL